MPCTRNAYNMIAAALEDRTRISCKFGVSSDEPIGRLFMYYNVKMINGCGNMYKDQKSMNCIDFAERV